MAEVGEIRVSAYRAGGFLAADSDYARTLRGLGAEDSGHVLVAVLRVGGTGQSGTRQSGTRRSGTGQSGAWGGEGADQGGAERIVGTVMLQVWPHAGQVVTGPGEAEIRALAVRPEAQGAGIGLRLVRRVIERAGEVGVSHLVLCTEPEMRAARRIYERAGFVRLPGRDWSPVPQVTLLAYGLRLG